MKDIKNYEGLYAVTSCGKIWSYNSKKFLKPCKNERGYHIVALCKNGKVKVHLIHRLVACAYIENPHNYETVDHKDNCKEHNYINNLQWLTNADNVRKEKCKKIVCVETGEMFNSIIECARQMNLHESNINFVLNGKRNHTGGYTFEYVED